MEREDYYGIFVKYTYFLDNLFSYWWRNYPTIDFDALRDLQEKGRYNAFLYVNSSASELEQRFFTEKIIQELDRVLLVWKEAKPNIRKSFNLSEPKEITKYRKIAYYSIDLEEIRNIYSEKYLAKEKQRKQLYTVIEISAAIAGAYYLMEILKEFYTLFSLHFH